VFGSLKINFIFAAPITRRLPLGV